MKINIPNLNAVNAIILTKKLQEVENEQDYTLDFCNMSNFDPFAMLLCSSAIRQFRKQRKNASFKLLYYNNKNIQYAGHMGFFKSISPSSAIGKSPGEAHGSSNYLPITKIEFSEFTNLAIQDKIHVGQVIENKASQLSKILSRNNESLSRLFTYIIREMIRNSHEHSHSDCVWICAQYWPSIHSAEIAILDEGIGIKNSLIKNSHYIELIQDDKSAITWALKPGITESFKIRNMGNDIWDNSGFGLYMASNLCPALGGEFLITSGNSVIVRTHEGKTFVGKANHNGTAIRITIDTNNVNDYDRIRKEILDIGEKEAKKIEKAAKKASYSSKGLIDYLK